MASQKRSFIDVGPPPDYNASRNCDPLELFACMLRNKYGGTDDTEQSNFKLLEDLITKRKIAKSSIIWHNDTISRIYGFRVNNKGGIEYDPSGKSSQKAKLYVTNAPPIDMSSIRNAILKSKQIAI